MANLFNDRKIFAGLGMLGVLTVPLLFGCRPTTRANPKSQSPEISQRAPDPLEETKVTIVPVPTVKITPVISSAPVIDLDSALNKKVITKKQETGPKIIAEIFRARRAEKFLPLASEYDVGFSGAAILYEWKQFLADPQNFELKDKNKLLNDTIPVALHVKGLQTNQPHIEMRVTDYSGKRTFYTLREGKVDSKEGSHGYFHIFQPDNGEDPLGKKITGENFPTKESPKEIVDLILRRVPKGVNEALVAGEVLFEVIDSDPVLNNREKTVVVSLGTVRPVLIKKAIDESERDFSLNGVEVHVRDVSSR